MNGVKNYTPEIIPPRKDAVSGDIYAPTRPGEVPNAVSIIDALRELGNRHDIDAQVERCGLLMQKALNESKLSEYYKFMQLQCQLLGHVEQAKTSAKIRPQADTSDEQEEEKRKSEEYYQDLHQKLTAPPVLPEKGIADDL